jgi:hypothetical protein
LVSRIEDAFFFGVTSWRLQMLFSVTSVTSVVKGPPW